MKYAIIVPDGMADYPLEDFDGRTPMQMAKTPHMDRLAREGSAGLARTIPWGMAPGSDVANLSVVGYNPKKYYSGRAPLEAASMRVELAPTDLAFRCNLVTVSGDSMADFSAGHISNKEAHALIDALNAELASDDVRFYPGVSYRHLLVYRGAEKMSLKTTPPHDITGKRYAPYLPRGRGSGLIRDLMERSRAVIEPHEINKVRVDLGENPATQIWLWGEGHAPEMEPFVEKYGLTGAMITAVDLLKGIAVCLGWDVIDVPGATAYLDTDYAAKGEHAVAALDSHDLVYVHVEAPDEAGHGGLLNEKVMAIQRVDREVVGRIVCAAEQLNAHGPGCRVLVVPDHLTPVSKRTHTPEPVPFVMWGRGIEPNGAEAFSELAAKGTRLKLRRGFKLMERLLASS